MQEKSKIPAVFKEDLLKLLQSMGEAEPINKGERICKVCSKNISVENIQLIIPRQGNIFDFICDSPVEIPMKMIPARQSKLTPYS